MFESKPRNKRSVLSIRNKLSLEHLSYEQVCDNNEITSSGSKKTRSIEK